MKTTAAFDQKSCERLNMSGPNQTKPLAEQPLIDLLHERSRQLWYSEEPSARGLPVN